MAAQSHSTAAISMTTWPQYALTVMKPPYRPDGVLAFTDVACCLAERRWRLHLWWHSHTQQLRYLLQQRWRECSRFEPSPTLTPSPRWGARFSLTCLYCLAEWGWRLHHWLKHQRHIPVMPDLLKHSKLCAFCKTPPNTPPCPTPSPRWGARFH